MGNVVDLHDVEPRIAAQRVSIVRALRALADRLKAAPAKNLREALPIAAGSVAELERYLAPWLPEFPGT